VFTPASSTARAAAGRARPDRQNVQAELAQGIDAVCAELYREADGFRPLLDTADPLAAELHAAELLARFTAPQSMGAIDLAFGLVAVAARHPQPHVAAMTAALNWLMPGMATSMALNDLASKGVRPPAWYEHIGQATPAQAWRYRDVFGERQAVLVTFFYHDTEHALLVETLTCPAPRVRTVRISTAAQLHTLAQASADQISGYAVMEEISLQQAHAVLAPAMQHPSQPAADPDDHLVLLPVAYRRLTRLPQPEQVDQSGYTKADRAAAVQEFLTTNPLPGIDRAVLRFWAQALAGYTATTASAPTRIGPLWLTHALIEHVPRVFELTTAQRAGMLPAVTAWIAWATRVQGLPEAATDQLTAHLVEIDKRFDAVYTNPDLVPIRCYLSDIAAITADGEDLQRAYALRTQAVPPPHLRPAAVNSLLASDPEQRRRILAAYAEAFGHDEDISLPDWLDALALVSDQLWHNDPPQVGQAVLEYLDGEGPDLDLLGDLAELAIKHTGDTARYLTAIHNLTLDT
jgi:hypothetical protein